VGLDVESARRSVEKHRHLASIEKDIDLADDVDAGGTPTFFINGRKLVGARSLAAFVEVIDEQLLAAGAALARGVAPGRLYETLQQDAKLAPVDTVTVPAPTAASPSPMPNAAAETRSTSMPVASASSRRDITARVKVPRRVRYR